MSFTATLQRGVDSCEAVKNHMVCATAPASAELGIAAEQSARHGEGAGEPSLKVVSTQCRSSRQEQQNVPRALAGHCGAETDGRDYTKGEKKGFTLSGGL